MAVPSIAPISFRRCSRCRLWKQETLENFHFERKRQVWSSRCKPCATAVVQESYWADPEKKKAYARARYRANSAVLLAQTRAYTLAHADENRAYQRKWAVEWRAKLKAELLEAYGNRCACPSCTETHSHFLTLEHVNRDGAEHRRRLGGQIAVFRELQRLGWPKDGYCLLCWSCQLSSWYGGACAHSPDYRPSKPRHYAAREAVIAAYGGRCA